ncbi:winged-helix domain-containing protein [Methylocapsa polymorpha]|uniref:Winged-helix domain-containing protein n=1 Tax=Methylocapsa polymorpha TaxID=3080828 RepID=A0ABZ0HN00_9HYPH|nr:winged-helix domain-containing protein [Methylocapsa sp. RX1]
MSKVIMDTALERIHAKIAELEAKIGDLRIAERELQALDKISARPTRPGSEPKARRKPGPKATPKPKLRGKPKASAPAEAHQTIGAAIAEVLDQHGALSAADIAERIKATGRDISNRTVSFSLQALKKRGLVKSADGKWTLKTRSRRARQSAGGEAHETASAG